MANEFIARKGLIVHGDVHVSGSSANITASGNISASGTGSFSVIETPYGINFTDDNHSDQGAKIFYNNQDGDKIVFQAGTRNLLEIQNPIEGTTGEVVINEDSLDVNFRVESNSNEAMFYVDGDDNKVGIGTISPGKTLEVIGDISASGKLFGGLTETATSKTVFYNTTTGELTYGTRAEAFTATGISGSSVAGISTLSSSVATSFGLLSGSLATDIATNISTISTLQVKPSEGAFADGDKTKLDALLLTTAAAITGSTTELSSSIASDITDKSSHTAVSSSINTLSSSIASDITEKSNHTAVTSSINTLSGSVASDIRGKSSHTAVSSSINTLSGSVATSFGLLSGSLATDIATNIIKVGVTEASVRGVGALMDDEINQEAIKGINQPLSTTSDVTFANLTVTSLTASIVTSSVVYASGSNIFGDASNDSHTFNGHITASGDISASGTIVGSNLSGTNTGDQDLSDYANHTAISSSISTLSSSIASDITDKSSHTAVSSSINVLSGSIASDITDKSSHTAVSSSISTLSGSVASDIRTKSSHTAVSSSINILSGSVATSLGLLSGSLAVDIATNTGKVGVSEASVRGANALMDDEVTNLADVKSFDTSDYATAAQGAKADSAQQPPSEGAFVNGDKTKLDGIESGATADQTNAEIRAAVEAATDSNVFTDDDHTKLNAIEAGATGDQDLSNYANHAAISSSISTLSSSIASDITEKSSHTAVSSSINVLSGSVATSLGLLSGSLATDIATNISTISTLQVKPSEGAFANGDKTKLDGIEAGATADQDLSGKANHTAVSSSINILSGSVASDIRTKSSHTAVSSSINILSGSVATSFGLLSGSIASDIRTKSSHTAISSSINVLSGSVATSFGLLSGSIASDIAINTDKVGVSAESLRGAGVVMDDEFISSTELGYVKAINQSLTTTSNVQFASLTVNSISSSRVTSSILYTSGSNIFGDAIVDTQTFSGHITASGDISASGDLLGSNIYQDGTAIGSVYAPIAGKNTIVTVGTIGTGVWNGDAITHDYIGADAIDATNIADDAIEEEHIGDGEVKTAAIADAQVTYAKIQNVSATNKILGRDSAGAGVIEEISPADVLTMLGVETSATADQTDAEIRAAVEAATDSNVFTDADHTKLNALLLTTATAITGSTTSLSSSIASDIRTKSSHTAVSSSISTLSGSVATSFGLLSGSIASDITEKSNHAAVSSSISTLSSSIASDIRTKSSHTAVSSSISTLQVKPSEGAFVDGDKTKLDAIEASATADQTDAEIRAAVEAATDSNVFTDDDHTKLNAIEPNATADQTNDEIKAAVEAASDSNVFTDADHTKLDALLLTTAVAITGSTAELSSSIAIDIRTKSSHTAVSSSINVLSGSVATSFGLLSGSLATDIATNISTISTLQVKPSEGAFANGDKTKLDGIEAGATADQSKTDIEGLAITSVGALGGGSITSGFGAIDNGVSGIRTNTFTAETAFVPDANDGATLGTTALSFSDLYLAEGGVINWDNGDVTITQTGNILAIAGTELVTVQGEIKTDDRVRGGEIITKPSGSDNHSVHIKGGQTLYFDSAETDPDHSDYAANKEKARIRAVPGSFNLTFEISGSGGYTSSMYISQSGNIGFNTNDPQSAFDAIVDEAQFQRPGARKGLKINQEGNIESFNKDADSAATGSEFILRYSRGSATTQESLASVGINSSSDDNAIEVFNAFPLDVQNAILEKLEYVGFTTVPRAGDVIGSIRFVAESGSLSGFNDRVAGEAASIQSVIHSVDATGVRGDLVFKVADQSGTSVQRMVIDAGDNHQLSGSLDIGGTSTTAGNITINGAGGNRLASLVRYGANSYDQKVGRFLLYDDGTQKVQFSAKGKSYITATNDGTHTTGARLGIETTDPKVELEVVGDISASGTITGNVGTFNTLTTTHITASGNVSASGNLSIDNIYLDGAIEGPSTFVIYSGYTNRGRMDLFSTTAYNSSQVKLYGGTAQLIVQKDTGVEIVGDVTASANISASGDITFDTFLNFGATTGEIRTTNPNGSGNIEIIPDGTLKLGNSRTDHVYIGRQDNTNYTTRIYGGNSTENIKTGLNYVQLNVPVTASGNISASGTVTANSFVGSFTGAVTGDATGLTGTPDISVGHITASGNISASGTGSFESIAIPGNSTDYYIGGSGGGVATDSLRIGSKTTGNTIALELFHGTNPVTLGIDYDGGNALAFVDNVHSSFDSVLQFKTGGSERFRIGALDVDTFQIKPAAAANDVEITDNSGAIILYSDTGERYVGIGSKPSAKLHVSGSDATDSSIRQSRAGVKIWDQAIDSSGRLQWGYRSSEGGSRTTTFTLDDNNNVGIGTGAPSAKLHVDGDALITGTVTAQEFHTEFVSSSIVFSSGSTKFGDTSDDLHSFTGSVHIQTSGSAGNNKFKLTTSAGNDVVTMMNANSDTFPVGSISVGYGSTTAGQIIGSSNTLKIRGGSSTSGKILFTNGSGGADKLVEITSDHLEVVGNISASGDLSVTNVSASLIRLPSGGGIYFDNGVGPKIIEAGNGLEFWANGAGSDKAIDIDGNGKITLFTHNGSGADDLRIDKGGTSTNLLYVSGSGNVGIGTTTPTDKLDVAGAARFTSNVSFDSGKAGRIYKASTHGLAIQGVAGSENDFAMFTPAGQLKIVVPTGTNNLILNRDSGNVGIGTSTPAEKLTVTGNISSSGTVKANIIAMTNIVTNRVPYFNGSQLDDSIMYSRNGGIDVEGHITASGNISSSGNIITTNVTASGNISASGEVIADVFRGESQINFQFGSSTWDAMTVSANGKLELASGGANDRAHLLLHADHGSSPRSSVIEFENEAQGSTFIFTDGDKNLKLHTSDPGLDQTAGSKVLLENSNISAGHITASGDIVLQGTAPSIRIQDTRQLNNPDWDNVSLGNIEFYSSDTTSPGARVLAEIEAFSNGAAASGPNSDLIFKTSTNADTSPQTRLTIGHDGTATFSGSIVGTIGTAAQTNITSLGQLTALNINGNLLFENNKELRWKDSGGSERTILELTNANDLYLGGSYAGSLIFVGGGSYAEVAKFDDSGHFVQASGKNLITNHITASANISASGDLLSSGLTVDGGTGVATTALVKILQSGNTSADGISITSAHANSHRIFKDVNGSLNIGSSLNTNAFVQDLSGNINIEGHITASGNISASGIILAGNGSSGAPSFAFGSNTNTGMFRPSPSQLGLVAGGVTNIQFGTNAVNIKHAGSTKLATTSTGVDITGDITASGKIQIPSYIEHEGDDDTYFGFEGANDYRVRVGGSDRFKIQGDVHVVGSTDFAIPATRKLYLDGQSNTYLSETSADTIKIFTGGSERLKISNTSTEVSHSLNVTGHITASGNISAAGTITATGAVHGADLELPSGGIIDWSNGDARIVEGETNNYSLTFKTYDGSAVSPALRLDGNNDATFTGNITASGNISASGTGSFDRVAIGSTAGTYLLNVNNEDNTSTNLFEAKRSSTYSFALNSYAAITSKVNGTLTHQIYNTNTGATTPLLELGHSNSGIAHITTKNANSLNLHGNHGVHILSNLTASGNISASGTGNNVLGGKVIIGSTTPDDVGGTSTLSVDVGTGQGSFRLQNGGTDGVYFRRITSGGEYQIQTTLDNGNSGILSLQSYGGNVGIGTVEPTEKLQVEGNISASGTLQASSYKISGVTVLQGSSDITIGSGGATGTISLTTHTSTPFKIENDDSISITSDTTITGALRATTKSFVIDTPEGGKLEYGSLEGRQHDVFHKGKCNGNIIELPKEWEWLIDDTTLTVQLTAIGKHQNLYVKEIKNNKVYISAGMFKTPNCYFLIHASRKDTEQIKHDN